MQAAIAQEAIEKKTAGAQVERAAPRPSAAKSPLTIHLVVRLGEQLLGRLWNRIYDGVAVRGAERLQALAKDNTLVYVPCHRSHIDYLLLSLTWCIAWAHGAAYRCGRQSEPALVGGILRRGGAFFLRRSIRATNFTVKCLPPTCTGAPARLPDGIFRRRGRSRTGRMLPPKAGLISMTVQSYLREHLRGRCCLCRSTSATRN